MSGGAAYVLDEAGDFETRCNRAMVELKRLSVSEEIKNLRGIIYRHLEVTDSARAKAILDAWPKYEPLFWKVAPLAPAAPAAPLAPNNVPVASSDPVPPKG
jgi:glutamate synthase domain-containing protein 3